jgi:hypothetical protein
MLCTYCLYIYIPTCAHTHAQVVYMRVVYVCLMIVNCADVDGELVLLQDKNLACYGVPHRSLKYVQTGGSRLNRAVRARV